MSITPSGNCEATALRASQAIATFKRWQVIISRTDLGVGRSTNHLQILGIV
ncbi:hypothetical protein H6F95_16730 [Cyanobacteria bacterium FACHB-471]|nr:hypothetical protein [Cyanobacteria bacterium FACHB-471]